MGDEQSRKLQARIHGATVLAAPARRPAAAADILAPPEPLSELSSSTSGLCPSAMVCEGALRSICSSWIFFCVREARGLCLYRAKEGNGALSKTAKFRDYVLGGGGRREACERAAISKINGKSPNRTTTGRGTRVLFPYVLRLSRPCRLRRLRSDHRKKKNGRREGATWPRWTAWMAFVWSL